MANQPLVELQALWKTLDNLEQRVKANKIYFSRNIGKQGAASCALNNGAAVVLILGSNRSGKSIWGAREVIAHAHGVRLWLPKDHPDYVVKLASGVDIPVPNVGRIIAQNYQQAVQQTIVPLIEEWAPAGSYKFKTDNRGIPTIILWTNGSKTFLMSNDQDDMAFEGPKGHYVWADEPIDKNKYVGLKRGLVDFSGHMFMTMTPLTQPWIHDVVVNRANEGDGQVRLFKFSIWDNCIDNGGYLRREDINEFLADLNEYELEARLHGNFLHLAGKVFKEWTPEEPYWIPARKLPDSWPRVCVIDPHPRKPVAVAWLAISPDDVVYVYRDLYDSKLVTINEVSERIKQLENWKEVQQHGKTTYIRDSQSENVVIRIIDDSSKQEERTSGDSVFRRFADTGIHCALARKRNANAGIDAIHDALRIRYDWGQPGLIIFNNCLRVKQNFLNYCWDEWATGKQADLREEKQEARKRDDDFIACIRYYYQHRLSYQTLKSNRREEEDDYHYEPAPPAEFAIQGPMTRRERQKWMSSRSHESPGSDSQRTGLLRSINHTHRLTVRTRNPLRTG